MSGIEFLKGKLVPVNIINSLESTANLLLKQMNIEKDDYYDTCLEQLKETVYQTYVVTKDKIYEVVESRNEEAHRDIFDAILNNDKSIDFTLKYYNGGCCFNEAIEKALDKMETKLKLIKAGFGENRIIAPNVKSLWEDKNGLVCSVIGINYIEDESNGLVGYKIQDEIYCMLISKWHENMTLVHDFNK